MRTWLLGFLCLFLLLPAAAAADPPRFERFDRTSLRFDALVGVGWYSDVGPGFRVEVPLIRDLAKGIPNVLYASSGIELRWFYHPQHDGFGAYPIFAGQWDFLVSDRWVIFPELGFAGIFAPYRKRFWRPFIAPYAGGGARYYFSRRNAVVFRLGWPTGAQVGITF